MFGDSRIAWWHRELASLISGIEALLDSESGLARDTLAEPFGWGIAKREEFARTIEERSIEGAAAAPRWREAIAAIAESPKYSGLVLTPQIGLVPIGVDPASGLWEFAHLQTGEPAARGADGELVLTEETGIVLVLIPPGSFLMGAQSTDPDGQNYDPWAAPHDGPPSMVELPAYFLSKYETTQGQWMRIAASNPSSHRATVLAPTLLHPVERVSWTECRDLLQRVGLRLPTEAQWEKGARGGRSTAWWTGQERESLRGKVNLADQAAKRAGATFPAIADWPDLDDGSAVHAEIGHYPANAFGLHEVAGNVWEWCRDDWSDAYSGSSDGPRGARSPYRVIRGSSFASVAGFARSASRDDAHSSFRGRTMGVRAARNVEL